MSSTKFTAQKQSRNLWTEGCCSKPRPAREHGNVAGSRVNIEPSWRTSASAWLTEKFCLTVRTWSCDRTKSSALTLRLLTHLLWHRPMKRSCVNQRVKELIADTNVKQRAYIGRAGAWPCESLPSQNREPCRRRGSAQNESCCVRETACSNASLLWKTSLCKPNVHLKAQASERKIVYVSRNRLWRMRRLIWWGQRHEQTNASRCTETVSQVSNTILWRSYVIQHFFAEQKNHGRLPRRRCAHKMASGALDDHTHI